LHRAFRSPQDTILFDTGHQAYVHKIITGRSDRFDTLRQPGGLSGYPSRAESEHDVIENSHASTALSWADGLAKAHAVRGITDRKVVAVVGDGALTGGMAWEALNNIAAADRPMVIVVNDNERSYSPTIGGLAKHLARLRTDRRYESLIHRIDDTASNLPMIGAAAQRLLHSLKRGAKTLLAPQCMFADLGLKYLGPIDGHDVAAVEDALRIASDFDGPVIVHCITRKGFGYSPSENDVADRHHSIGPFDPDTGIPAGSAQLGWTSVFGQEMAALAEQRSDLVAITAAMCGPVGLEAFAASYPDRVFDVGIAEQHAATCAAGLALGGLHPVVAVYATFLNRCFDQVLMDVALHRAAVTFVLDRAGVTGDDGASHNGMWDLSILQVVPGLRIASPRDAEQLRLQLREAVEVTDGPTVVRFPKGLVGPDIPARGRIGGIDLLAGTGAGDVLIVGIGSMAGIALAGAELLGQHGLAVTVVDPRWIKPVPEELVGLANDHRVVLTVEDNGRAGGVGSAIAQALLDGAVEIPLHNLAIPQRFHHHGKRDRMLQELGLTPEQICRVGLAMLERGHSFSPSLNAVGA
jgi:1-deoxy-D-xylulose-5-phosphate synthase